MAKIKLTNVELKKQKDSLKRFERYLPTLQLKKKQLQIEAQKIDLALAAKEEEYRALLERTMKWVAVFGEEVELEELVKVIGVVKGTDNIAGVDIPIFEKVLFGEAEYDLFVTPLWVDAGVARCRELLAARAEMEVLREQARLIRAGLRVTTQRVNLFEKIKIPQTKENIRVIRIFMGDQQTAAVVRGKISKKKLVERQAR